MTTRVDVDELTDRLAAAAPGLSTEPAMTLLGYVLELTEFAEHSEGCMMLDVVRCCCTCGLSSVLDSISSWLEPEFDVPPPIGLRPGDS